MKSGNRGRCGARWARMAVLLVWLAMLPGCSTLASWIPGTDAQAERVADHRWQELLRQQRERRGAIDTAKNQDDRPAEDHLRDGDRFLDAGNLSQASMSYLRAHYRDPEAEAPLARIGFMALAREPERSARYFVDLLSERPKDPELLLGLGAAQLGMGEVGAAIGTLESARRDAPSRRLQSVLGVAYDRAGRSDEAQAAYRIALELSPGDPAILNNLGISLLLAQRFGEAVEVFRLGRQGASRDRTLANNLGIALTFNSQYEEALESFQSLGSRGDALNNLGYALMLKGELGTARSFFEEALISNETDERRVLQNLSLLDQIEADQARLAEQPSPDEAQAASPAAEIAPEAQPE